MSQAWREECAVFGVWNHDEAARLAYLGLYALQHRGQEASGIVSLHEGTHVPHRGIGLVGDIFDESALVALPGRAAIGHNRYSTTGQNSMANVQPFTANLFNGPVSLAHNGNLVNAEEIRRELQLQGSIFQGTSDTECFLHLISRSTSSDFLDAFRESLLRVRGAYSLVVMTDRALVAARDPLGFRPLIVGSKSNEKGETAYFVASETCAFDLLGVQLLREIEPGEIFWADDTGIHFEKFSEKKQTAQCVFEYVYFSRPDSTVFGRNVYQARKEFGRWLAREFPVEADLVIPVPDSGISAALGYSDQSKIPFDFGIIRNHYVGRTFIQPHPSIRSFGVKVKLNAQSAVLEGKRVIVIDDSLVRGTTSQKIVRLMRQAGAREVHMRIAAPPTTGPCYYGVDTPQKSHLIAANQTVEQIRAFIEADSLAYLSIEGMFAALKSSHREFCAACFDGQYPTELDHDPREVSAPNWR